MVLTLKEALEIVLNLARQNVIEDNPDMEEEQARQLEALATAEDFAVNLWTTANP